LWTTKYRKGGRHDVLMHPSVSVLERRIVWY
jgi:hypothetical protein